MKFLMAAFGITLGTSLAIYSGLRLLTPLQGEAVFSFASFPFLASGHIYEVLERRAAKAELSSAPHLKLVSFTGFGLPWYRLLILALLLFMASVEALSGYTALVTQAMDAPLKLPVIALVVYPINALVTFLIGRWMGSRCRNVAVAMGIFSLAIAATLFLDHFIALQMYSSGDGDDDPAALFGTLNSSRFYITLACGAAAYSVIGWLGVWRGARAREERYTVNLLRLLPRSSRAALIGLARDEAEALVRRESEQAA